MQTHSLARLVCVGVMAASGAAASAAPTTWTGAVDNDWSNAGNWSAGAPGNAAGDTATIDLGGAVVNTTASVNTRHVTVSGLGVTPVLNIGHNFNTQFSNFIVGGTASGSGTSGTVNHTAGTVNVGAGATTLNLFIAALASTSPASTNTGTYNFGGDQATAPTLTVAQDLRLGSRVREVGNLTLKDYGAVTVTRDVWLAAFNGAANVRVEGGNLTFGIGGNLRMNESGAGGTTITGVITDTGLSTINVAGQVWFETTTDGDGDNDTAFALELGPGYAHNVGSVYTVLSAAGGFSVTNRHSTFGNVADGDVLTVSGFDFEANYNTGPGGDTFTLTAIPEPGVMGLVAVGAALLVGRRSR